MVHPQPPNSRVVCKLNFNPPNVATLNYFFLIRFWLFSTVDWSYDFHVSWHVQEEGFCNWICLTRKSSLQLTLQLPLSTIFLIRFPIIFWSGLLWFSYQLARRGTELACRKIFSTGVAFTWKTTSLPKVRFSCVRTCTRTKWTWLVHLLTIVGSARNPGEPLQAPQIGWAGEARLKTFPPPSCVQ